MSKDELIKEIREAMSNETDTQRYRLLQKILEFLTNLK